METRDGVILRSDIYRPDDNGKYPAIMTRTPYNKIGVADQDYGFMKIVRAGYAVVIQDTRGRYASEGIYDGGDFFLSQESPDGYDAVEWVAARPWCNGDVGTSGGSYMSRVQYLLAMERPPHLKAMAPSIPSDTPCSQATVWYGVVPLIMGASSSATVGMDIAEKLKSQGKDVTAMFEALEQIVSSPLEVLSYLPLKEIPQFNFEGLKEVWNNRGMAPLPFQEHPEKFFWDYTRIEVPCLHQSGWYDFNEKGAFANYRSLKEKGGSGRCRSSQHLLVGPWVHGQFADVLGGINFGGQASGSGARLSEYTIAFFDKYLKGKEVDLPAVRYFVMGKNRWETASDWPLPQTKWQRFFLHSRGHANTAGGDGWLHTDQPVAEPPDRYIYDPLWPVPTTGGAWAHGNGFVPGPQDQSHIEKRRDVLCYTTPELKNDLEITGPLELHLFASTTSIDTDFTAKLVDVYPDGRCYNIADGIIRGRFRKSTFSPALLTPGEVTEFVINLIGTSCLFRKGHRLRIDVASSNFPAFDRNMNTGNPSGEDASGIPVMQTVFHDGEYASYIDLPVIE